MYPLTLIECFLKCQSLESMKMIQKCMPITIQMYKSISPQKPDLHMVKIIGENCFWIINEMFASWSRKHTEVYSDELVPKCFNCYQI